jgi:hypothetical protein
MNPCQELWWRQACSDHGIWTLLRSQGASPCHQLHYLQMTSEKIGKAYFWGSGHPPPKNHAGFVKFLRALTTDRSSNLSFRRIEDLQSWLKIALPLAYELERLAPQLAGDGPNPEYPWPHVNPKFAPATFDFRVWTELNNSGHGHRLLKVVGIAVRDFPAYG